jgi:formylglycine-generating enzyme required for sulfatase activity
MVWIEAGRFAMGAPESESRERRFGWGGPPVAVTLRERFALGVTEVTRAEWAQFIAASGYVMPNCVSIWQALVGKDPPPTWQDPRFPGGFTPGDDHPVVCVSWSDANAYVDWLNRTAKARLEFFLPSEAQWEYAARAAARGLRPWRGAVEQACRYANVGDRRYRNAVGRPEAIDCDDGFAYTSPVRHFAANAWGLYGMLGNAWEWTADCWFADHTRNPRDGAALTAALGGDCARRTMRGAGFPSSDWYLRFTTRGGDPLETRFPVIGFRVAARLLPNAP